MHPGYEAARRDWFTGRLRTVRQIAEVYGVRPETARRWTKRWLAEALEMADEHAQLARIQRTLEEVLSAVRSLRVLIERKLGGRDEHRRDQPSG